MPFSPMPLEIKPVTRLDGRAFIMKPATALVRYIPFDDNAKLPGFEVVRGAKNNGDPINHKYFAIRTADAIDKTQLLVVHFAGNELSEALAAKQRDQLDLSLYSAIIDGAPIQLELSGDPGDPLIIKVGYISG